MNNNVMYSTAGHTCMKATQVVIVMGKKDIIKIDRYTIQIYICCAILPNVFYIENSTDFSHVYSFVRSLIFLVFSTYFVPCAVVIYTSATIIHFT